ncbi:hypothetical protein HYN59_00700 [Flavobacterium album]|uniref:TonB C-terminal domain-containing protein n=1 Tax=Flavobacterium album TaxID=2175091 RepID=A0A2S1QTJ0_9FLAO|nr:energy transducer TonB [Flavobacterium album]AWH83722.1 hypothetical protein HYN59_00700 [Flavobacterium album]
MKQLFFAAIFTFFALNYVSAQETKPLKTTDYSLVTNDELQTKPEFPGGVSEFYQYIIDNFKPESKLKGVQKLYVYFVIEKDGSISIVKILKGLDEKNDENLIKVIQNSPKWSPGIQNGKPVRASFNLPLTINFK